MAACRARVGVAPAVALGESHPGAHPLGVVVPEEIETETQAQQAIDLGCTVGQGYLFGRPQPAAGITALLERD
jgi:sensor c-di-GMP phosphodiesterase-like protein